MKHYLFIVFDDVDPEIHGPYATPEERDSAARTFRKDHGSDHGLFPFDIGDEGDPETWAYNSWYLDEDNPGLAQADNQ